ncbi:hypothetical protein BG015_004729 [Linnemannia schmuckeri]|uniref:F-box domain-containing protein n=1 Tax=Linnemannia schmuckeri TaxID=64567 RepID=A0A9P5S447_9FUNG|nr:hypothetical protein BG015_004729 [Linnemannia schmuckeri]
MLQADNPSTVGTPNAAATITATETIAAISEDSNTMTTPEAALAHAMVTLSSANRVFQIPELADNIAVYLRPIYMSQLRLVSRALYIAYRPHLRLHLHRGSTESWTSFPTLQDPIVADTTTIATVTTATTVSKTADKEEPCDEGEVKERTLDSDAVAKTTTTATATTLTTTTPSATSAIAEAATEPPVSLVIQDSNLRPQQQQQRKQHDKEEKEKVEALKPAPKKAGNRYGYEDGLTYGNLVETLTTDSLDNLERLIPIMRQCPNIHTLSITRWNKELSVFEDLLHNSPRLKTLSVAFYTTVDLTEFLRTLTGTSASSKADGIGSTAAGAQGRQRGAGCRTLQSLDIKHRVPDINPIEWKALKAALDVLPSLRHLSLTGVEFTGGVDNNGEGGVVGGPGVAPQGLAAFLNGSHSTLTPWHSTTTGTSASSFSLSSMQPQQLQGIFPKIQSLSLSICDCPASTMQEINRVFPGLTSLELNRCRSNWFQVFEPDPSMPASPHLDPTTASVTSFVSPTSNAVSVSIATGALSSHINHSTPSSQTHAHPPAPVLPRVPFPELRHLKLTARQGYEILLFNLDLVAHRPYLTSIEIYDMSLKIETLSSLVSVCKSEGRFLKRWAHSVSGAYMSLDEIQTYLSWDEIQTNEVPSLSKVQHLYVQKPGVVSFGSTLTSLHIGDEGNFRGTYAMRSNVIKTWNELLQKLPRLRVLKIDQRLKGYCIFQHLGHQPVIESACCSNKVCSIAEAKDKEVAPTTATEGTMTEEGCAKEGEHQAGSFETSEGAWSIQVSSPSSTTDHHYRNIPYALSAAETTELTDTSAPTPAPTLSPILTPVSVSSATETATMSAASTPKLETPFLEELHVTFEWDLDVSTADLDRELIQRFRLLERLYMTSMRKPDGFAAFTKQTRPGLAIVHRRHENL